MAQDTLARVIESIASTTRYPIQLLTVEADLENDLGIDSVKRLEIVLALGEEFQLPLDREPRDGSIRTIQNVAQWVDEVASRQHTVSSARIDQSTAKTIPAPLSPRSSHANTTAPAAVGFQTEPRFPVPSTPESWRVDVPPHADSRIRIRTDGDARSSSHRDPFPNGLGHQSSLPKGPQDTTERLAPSNGLPEIAGGRSLRGKVALVTGSGRGVGQTIARLLGSRGATVIVNSFHSREMGEQTVSEINSGGGSAVHLWGSVANPQHVNQIFHQIEAKFGRLDILICNASDGRIGSFLELDGDDWDRAFRTNVVGHHQCAVRAGSLMRSHGGGSIVTMSAVGSHGYIEGLGSQGVVKAAVETMTCYLACELGQYGVRVNCVVGGPVYGDLLAKFPNARATQHHWESMTPDGTLCSSMDLANAIGFLVSDESAGVNGSIWNVDHGFSATADGRPLRYSVQHHFAQ